MADERRIAEVGAIVTAIGLLKAEVNGLAAASRDLADSNRSHGKAMQWLTAALVAVALLQVVVLALQLFVFQPG